MKDGGFGLRSAVKHSSAAYLASINGCERKILATSKNISQTEQHIQHARNECLQSYAKTNGSALERPLNLSNTQKDISTTIDQHVKHKLLFQASEKSKARILSSSGSHGSAVLTAPLAKSSGFKLNNTEFQFYISTRLGLKICAKDSICTLKNCNKPLDSFGFHSATCKSGGCTVRRHDRVRDIIFDYCQSAAWSSQKEIQPLPTSHLVPGDIFLESGGSHGNPLALDVTIVHPHSHNLVRHASVTLDWSNSKAEEKKNLKYLQLCKQDNVDFKPLSIEFYGRFSSNTSTFLFTLSKAVGNRSGRHHKSVYREIERRISISIIKSNSSAHQLRSAH